MKAKLSMMFAAVGLICIGCSGNRMRTVQESPCCVEEICMNEMAADNSILTAELFTQIALGKANNVSQLIESGANPNGIAADGDTALILAIEQNRVPISKMLINSGADVNGRSGQGITPLMQVVLNGNKAIPKTLSDGTVVAIQPQTNMQQYFADLLISKGADINACDNNGDSALALASSVGNFDAVRYLLQSNAEVNKKNLSGQTPLMIASKKGHYSIAEELLLANAGINDVDEEGQSALMYSAQNDNPHLVELLLSYGAKCDIQDQYGATAHTIANAIGNYKVTRVLKGFAAAEEASSLSGD